MTSTPTTTGMTSNLASLTFIRNWLGQLLDTLSDEQMYHQPCSSANNAVWIMGHLAWCDDMFLSQLGGGESTVPAEWKALFGDGSTPTDDPSAYPGLDDLEKAFTDNRKRVVAWFETFGEAKLTEPLPDDWQAFAPTYGAMIQMMAAHEGVHLGQLTVVRRSLGMKPAMR